MTKLIKNGTVVSATGQHAADVLIDGETIAAVLLPGTDAAIAAEAGAEQVIDATGKYVVPGGIDAHTHMELPFGGTFASDTFETGSRAAAWGGTTTIIDFAVQKYGENVRDSLDQWFAKAEGECAVDYAFHMILGGVDEAALKEMDTLVAEGITSFKLFMAYPGVFYSDDGQILRAMQMAANNGALISMHAENGIAIDVLAEQAASRGQTDPIYHGISRPSLLEGEATHRAIQLALVAGAPVYFVHLSASEALEAVAKARNDGHNVFAETCPQYLYLNLEDHLGAPGFEGAKYVCSSPLRTKHHTHHKDLWQGLRTNDLSIVATDHCPFCMKDQKELGVDDFRAIPNGIGGVEHRMDLIYQGVVMGELTLERWVETCSTTPARMFGLYPQKGVIAPGSDADIVLYDPAAKTNISVDTHHMNMDYSAYEGIEVDGKIDTVMSKGKVIISDDAYHGTKGDGNYLKRGLSTYLH
ncbi:MAG TPA: dihydropyrimidinase [Acidimicrobiales bacterium]|nr:dihydropyrimidinase [Acidimicrobiales bacterium]|tara:strand:- start:1709 stop:3121 length:1413 start_codon:yes stop_codon:yes gene_type:complete